MYPDHYTVPDGLHIRLIGTVRWGVSRNGHNVTTLWLDPSGNAYYCEDVWTALAVPFWMATAMSDLVQCDINEFTGHVNDILNGITDEPRHTATKQRYEELVFLWGTAVGVNLRIWREGMWPSD